MDIDILVVKDTFLQWISDKVTAAQLSALYPAYGLINSFCCSKNIFRKTLYEITNIQTIFQIEADICSPKSSLVISKEQLDAVQAALRLYRTFLESNPFSAVPVENEPGEQADVLWEQVLKESFPDGYVLDDYISQLQAVEKWEEICGEPCPLQGNELDKAISACGTVKDGHVFPQNADEDQLIQEIANTISKLLHIYSSICMTMIYQRYCQQLAGHAIYTEAVLADLVLQHSNGSFIKSGNWFVSPGKAVSVIEDCKKVMRDFGSAMSVEEIHKQLWFIPYDTIYHALSAEEDCINIGRHIWMLAEHFPLTSADVVQIADVLDKELNLRSYISYRYLVPLLYSKFPSVAENLGTLEEGAIFNVLRYYLKNYFSFTKAIVAPLGQQIDANMLYENFAAECDQFSLTDLEAFSSEIGVSSIYWEAIFTKAVRVSETDFVNKNAITFDTAAIDHVLEDFCDGDYLPFKEIQQPMMMHLPPCGYPWNGYLLLSYVYGYSKTFHIIYRTIGKTGYYGAMVRRSCPFINSYEDLVEHVLTDRVDWNSRADALALLVSSGYQAAKRLNGIDRLIERARLNKLNKQQVIDNAPI